MSFLDAVACTLACFSLASLLRLTALPVNTGFYLSCNSLHSFMSDICVRYDVLHWSPDGLDDDKWNTVVFRSMNDALKWAAFYDKHRDDDDEYTRTWFIRGVYVNDERMDLGSNDYLPSDLSWDQIDALPVAWTDRYGN